VVSLDARLDALRATYRRLGPAEAAAAAEGGALLVDIRYASLRDRDGTLPGAVIVERNELEWRLDPAGSHRIPHAVSYGLPVVVVCNEGYASTLAVGSLRDLGLTDVTDLAGGFQAWLAEGLPVVPPDGTPTRPTRPVAG
jgi:rhodanese-related sulfurtransferase